MQNVQNKTELTQEAITALRAESAAQGRPMKVIASELILNGVSPATCEFVRKVHGTIQEISSSPQAFQTMVGKVFPKYQPTTQPPASKSVPGDMTLSDDHSGDKKGVKPKIETVDGLGERIWDLRITGMSVRDIGAEVGYSKTAIENFLKRSRK